MSKETYEEINMNSENLFEIFLNGISNIRGVAIDREEFLCSVFKKYRGAGL